MIINQFLLKVKIFGGFVMKIKFIPAKDAVEAGRLGADIFTQTMEENPACVFGLATGSTPLSLYSELVLRYSQGKLDFSLVRTVNLDEYIGLPADHPQSYHQFMYDHLFSKINIHPRNTHLPNGMADDLESACREYEKMIESMGGIDLQLLGIGLNGHIGFNEPSDYFPKYTHVVDLTESTREANKRFFTDIREVPTQAITMGIGTIMSARKILLLCTGQKKAEILHEAMFGKVRPQVPASILQFHPKVIVIGDEEALSVIRRDYPDFL